MQTLRKKLACFEIQNIYKYNVLKNNTTTSIITLFKRKYIYGETGDGNEGGLNRSG